MKTVIIIATLYLSACIAQPVHNKETAISPNSQSGHKLWRRFVNPTLTSGTFSEESADTKMRTRRSLAGDCEKLELCKLHAQSGHSFIATFELYFVNKENARLWDHRQHTIQDCEKKFKGCFEDDALAPQQTAGRSKQTAKFIDNNNIDYSDDDGDSSEY